MLSFSENVGEIPTFFLNARRTTKFHQNKYGARPARAFPLVANKQHQAVISEISEIGWLRRLAVTARLAVLVG